MADSKNPANISNMDNVNTGISAFGSAVQGILQGMGYANDAQAMGRVNIANTAVVESMEVMQGFSQSTQEGIVQTAGAIGSIGGSIVGGLGAGALASETGPGAGVAAAAGAVVGGYVGENRMEQTARDFFNRDTWSPTVNVWGDSNPWSAIRNPDYWGDDPDETTRSPSDDRAPAKQLGHGYDGKSNPAKDRPDGVNSMPPSVAKPSPIGAATWGTPGATHPRDEVDSPGFPDGDFGDSAFNDKSFCAKARAGVEAAAAMHDESLNALSPKSSSCSFEAVTCH